MLGAASVWHEDMRKQARTHTRMLCNELANKKKKKKKKNTDATHKQQRTVVVV
jgi:hypothetical protein